MERVFVSWSGGKDCCLAGYRAAADGLDVGHLLNMVDGDGSRGWVHGLRVEVVGLQAEAMAIPLLQHRSTMDTYENDFHDALVSLKEHGITGGVFGDIEFDSHREWVTAQCRRAGLAPHLPIWNEPQEALLEEFIGAGFVAVVVAAEAERLGEKWLGRSLDLAALAELSELKNSHGVHPAGEAGEYHTLVIDGPTFRRRIEILDSKHVLRKGYWFLDISRAELRAR